METAGEEQKTPMIDPRGPEPGPLLGHGKVAGRHELAARRRGDPLDLGDHGLGQALEPQHHLRAGREHGIADGDILSRQIGEVVARAEVLAGGPDDEHLHLTACRDAGKKAVHLPDQGDGQGVIFPRAIQRDDADGIDFFEGDVLKFHDGPS